MAGNKKDNRSTDASMEERITIVQDLLLCGLTRSEILKECSTWKLSERQMDTYISKATATIKEINAVERDDNMAAITTNLWRLFRKNRDFGDLDKAEKNLMNIAKLKGLEETTINHIVKERPLLEIPDEELEAILSYDPNGRH